MPNGTYALTPEIDFSTADPVQGTPITITVSNLVSYPNYFTSVFGDWMWIYAEVAVYPANYQLDMYDSNTNYIGTFADYTPDGVISFTWDLTDGNGYTFPDTTFIGQFTITPTNAQMALHQTKSQARGAKPLAGSSTTVPARRWGKEGSWSGIGNFVVAYSAVDNDSTKTYKVGLMVLGGTDSSDGGAVGSLGFQGLGPYQLSPGNVYGSSAFYMGDSVTRTQLLSYLGDLGYRNFYFFGHGSANSFGGGTSLIPTITANDLQPVLRNLIVGNMGANYHPYRFVFIDGCSTGKGTMCEKFGVPSGTLNNAFFGTAGVRSRAYLGFTGSVPFDPSQWDWRSIMLGYFFGDWVSRKPLWVCVSNAVNGTYQTFQKMPSSAVIYGANDLQINSP
jgi:hypothetical protein